MHFYVPTLGDKIYLQEDWTFTLHRERRNNVFAGKIGIGDKKVIKNRGYQYSYVDWSDKQEAPATIPRGSCLIVDRIYIRGRNRNYDSITFRMDGSPDKRITKGRFWVKLKDANKIVCSLHPVVDDEAYERMKALDQRFGHLDLE